MKSVEEEKLGNLKNAEKRNAQGVLHCEDAPAVTWSDGSKCWFFHGKLHRLDGPAVEYSGGYKAWYIDNKLVSKKAYPIAIVMFLFDCSEKIAKVLLDVINNITASD